MSTNLYVSRSSDHVSANRRSHRYKLSSQNHKIASKNMSVQKLAIYLIIGTLIFLATAFLLCDVKQLTCVKNERSVVTCRVQSMLLGILPYEQYDFNLRAAVIRESANNLGKYWVELQGTGYYIMTIPQFTLFDKAYARRLADQINRYIKEPQEGPFIWQETLSGDRFLLWIIISIVAILGADGLIRKIR